MTKRHKSEVLMSDYLDHESCDDETCQECCPHDEYEHDECMYCGYQRDPGEAIDRAMDSLEDR